MGVLIEFVFHFELKELILKYISKKKYNRIKKKLRISIKQYIIN